MKIKNYIPNFEDCINIDLTKNTWVWIQNNGKNDYCVELHHKNERDTLVEDTCDFVNIQDFYSKKDIKRFAISEAVWLLPILYFRATKNNNIELANIYYETLSDIWFKTKQYINADLGEYMCRVEKDWGF